MIQERGMQNYLKGIFMASNSLLLNLNWIFTTDLNNLSLGVSFQNTEKGNTSDWKWIILDLIKFSNLPHGT